jgi:hypothetical protein
MNVETGELPGASSVLAGSTAGVGSALGASTTGSTFAGSAGAGVVSVLAGSSL